MKNMEELNAIFKLIVIEYDNDNHQYPEFDVFRSTIGCFSSREEAEQVMNKYEEEYDKTQYSLFGFVIKEYELDEKSEIKELVWYGNYVPDVFDVLSWKTLSKGDLVEVLHENTVTLEIVAEIPDSERIDDNGIYTCLSPCCEKAKEIYFASKEKDHTLVGMWFDCGCPCFRIIANNGKLSRINCRDMFPPKFSVSDELQNKLREMLLKNR